MRRKTNILGVLQAFVGLGAISAGLFLLIDPSGESLGYPIEMLEHSPFRDFFIPGLVLFTVNGLFHILGAWASFTKQWYAGKLGLGLGLFLVAWIIIQVCFIRSTHFLHFLYLGIGIIEIVIASKIGSSLKKKIKAQRSNSIPKGSLISQKFDDFHYCDSFSIVIQSDDSIDTITTEIFKTPKWADLLMGMRNAMFSLFGLDKGGYKDRRYIADYYPVGSRAVYFTVIDRNDNEIVTAENDKHLDFRISVFENEEEHNRRIHLTTLVKYHNTLGRFYFFIIRAFHRRIVVGLLKRLMKK